EKFEHQRERLFEAAVEQDQRAGDLLPCVARRIVLAEPEYPAEELEERQKGKELAMRDATRLAHRDTTHPTALAELAPEAPLAGAGLCNDPHDLRLTVDRPCKRRLEDGHLVETAHEA